MAPINSLCGRETRLLKNTVLYAYGSQYEIKRYYKKELGFFLDKEDYSTKQDKLQMKNRVTSITTIQKRERELGDVQMSLWLFCFLNEKEWNQISVATICKLWSIVLGSWENHSFESDESINPLHSWMIWIIRDSNDSFTNWTGSQAQLTDSMSQSQRLTAHWRRW